MVRVRARGAHLRVGGDLVDERLREVRGVAVEQPDPVQPLQLAQLAQQVGEPPLVLVRVRVRARVGVRVRVRVRAWVRVRVRARVA